VFPAIACSLKDWVSLSATGDDKDWVSLSATGDDNDCPSKHKHKFQPQIFLTYLPGCIKNPVDPHHCEICCSDYFLVKEYDNMPLQILFSIVAPYTKISNQTLGNTLKRMGFINGRSKRRSTLKERDYVVVARREYLRKKLANRKSGGGIQRPEVYLDETYLNVNHSVERTWYFVDDGPWVNKSLFQ